VSGKKEVSVIISALDNTLPGFKSARHNVQDFASEAKNLIAEAFAGFTVFEFFKTAVEKATEAEQSYVQLSNTLANVGVSYEHNRGQIEQTIVSLQKVANVRSDDAIKGFNTLVQRSGDYDGSLKNMVLTADLAKAKHLEFDDAAELVGRVMGGNTRVLKQFGIVTKDSTEGLRLLQERIGGAAAADMATFGGQVEATKIQFFNLAEAVGDIITGSSTLGGSMDDLREIIGNVTEYIEKNRADFVFWFNIVVAGGKEVVRVLFDAGKAAFYFGETLGNGMLQAKAALSGNMEDFKKYGQVGTAAFNNMIGAMGDVGGAADRLSSAIASATERQEATITQSAARLKANAARNAAEREAARQAEADKRAKERQKIEDEKERAKKKADDKITANIRGAGERGKAPGQREAALEYLKFLQDGVEFQLKGQHTLEETNVLEKRRNDILKERKDLHDDSLSSAERTVRMTDHPADQSDIAGNDKGDFAKTVADMKISAREGTFVDMSKAPQLSFMDALNKKWDDHRKQLAETGEAYKGFGDVLADCVSGPIAQFGESTAEAMGAMIVGSKNAGAAFRSALVGALGQVAKVEGDHFAALAIGDLAIQNYAGAAQNMAAATAMYAVSGAAGALSSGGSTGGGGASSQSAAVSTSSTLANSASGGPVKVYVPGKKYMNDINDPADRQALVDMMKSLIGTREFEIVVAD
jgi:hypothetical protein